MKPTKTMVEQKRRDSLNPPETLIHKYKSYSCPICSKLPEILFYNKSNSTLKLKCEEHNEMIMNISDYLEKMAGHERTSDLNNKNYCSAHRNQKFEYFCLTCKKNLCKDCLSDKKLENHENHCKYVIHSLDPDKKEILFIKNEIEMFFQKKNELLNHIKIIDDNIALLDTLLFSYESHKPNGLVNLNLKHLVYGEELNMDEIKNTEFVETQSKKDNFDEFVKNNFIKATQGLDKLNLVEQKLGNDITEELFKGIENSSLFSTLKISGQIQGPNEMITFEKIKYLNLRGNNLSSINFLLNKNLPNLEILSLNDNEITNIDTLQNISFPLLKELYLSKNKIDNIDVLEYMNTPSLRVLWLSNNNITNIDVLAKVKFPQLLKLCLSKNRITDLRVFIKHKSKFPQLYELYLNDNEFDLKTFEKIIGLLFSKVKQFYY